MASLADAISIEKFNQIQREEEAKALVNRGLDQAAIAQTVLFNLGAIQAAKNNSGNPTEVHLKSIEDGKVVWRKVSMESIAQGQVSPYQWSRMGPQARDDFDSEVGRHRVQNGDEVVLDYQRRRYQELYQEWLRQRANSVDGVEEKGSVARLKELIRLEQLQVGNGKVSFGPDGLVNEGARQRIEEYEKDLRRFERSSQRQKELQAEEGDRRRVEAERVQARTEQQDAIKKQGAVGYFERQAQEIAKRLNDQKIKHQMGQEAQAQRDIDARRLNGELIEKQQWEQELQRRKAYQEQERRRLEEVELEKARNRFQDYKNNEARAIAADYERDRAYKEQQKKQADYDAQLPKFWKEGRPETPAEFKKRNAEPVSGKPVNLRIPWLDPEAVEARRQAKQDADDAYEARRQQDIADRAGKPRGAKPTNLSIPKTDLEKIERDRIRQQDDREAYEARRQQDINDRKGKGNQNPKPSEGRKSVPQGDYEAWDSRTVDQSGKHRNGKPLATPNEPGSGNGGVRFPKGGGGGTDVGGRGGAYPSTPDPWTANGQKFGDNGKIQGPKGSQLLPGRGNGRPAPDTASQTQRQPNGSGVGVADRPRGIGGVKGRMPSTPIDYIPRPYTPDFTNNTRPTRRQSAKAGGLDAVGAVADGLQFAKELEQFKKSNDYVRALQEKYGLTHKEATELIEAYRPDWRERIEGKGWNAKKVVRGDVLNTDFDPYGPGGYEDMIKANRKGMSASRFRRERWGDKSVFDPVIPTNGGLPNSVKKIADQFEEQQKKLKAKLDKEWQEERKRNRDYWDSPERNKAAEPRKFPKPDFGDWPPFDPFGFPPGGGAPLHIPTYKTVGWIAEYTEYDPGWQYGRWGEGTEEKWRSLPYQYHNTRVFRANNDVTVDMAPPTVIVLPFQDRGATYFSHPDGYFESLIYIYDTLDGSIYSPNSSTGTYIPSLEEFRKKWGNKWDTELDNPVWLGNTGLVSAYISDRRLLSLRGLTRIMYNSEPDNPTPRVIRDLTLTPIVVEITFPGAAPKPVPPGMPLNKRDPKPLPPFEEEEPMPCKYAEDIEVPTPLQRFDWATGRPKTDIRNVHKGADDAMALLSRDIAELSKNVFDLMKVLDVKEFNSVTGKVMLPAAQAKVFGGLLFAPGHLGGPVPVKTLSQEMALWAGMNHLMSGHHMLGKTSFPSNLADPNSTAMTKPGNMLSHSQWQFNQVTNLIGIPNKQSTLNPQGQPTSASFKNQADAIETVNAQAVELKQDISGIEEYLQKMAQQNEQLTQMVFQLGKDVECLMKDAGFKTKQVPVQRPSVFTHGKVAERGVPGKAADDFSWTKTFELSNPYSVVRVWDDKIDKTQLGNKIHMEAQKAALSNFYPISKNAAYIPTLRNKAAKTVEENDWKKWVKTTENPGPMRQDGYSPIPDIEEITLGIAKEINTADVVGRIGD